MEMSNDLIKIINIKFQHPAEIVIEHHKQIPICQIEHHNKTDWKQNNTACQATRCTLIL